jgi:hypothetical protein
MRYQVADYPALEAGALQAILTTDSNGGWECLKVITLPGNVTRIISASEETPVTVIGKPAAPATLKQSRGKVH